MAYQHIDIPGDGQRIEARNGALHIPDRPIIPFIEGDGIGDQGLTRLG